MMFVEDRTPQLENLSSSVKECVKKPILEADNNALDELINNFYGSSGNNFRAFQEAPIKPAKKKNDELQKILAKSVITPDFESLHSLPPIDMSDKKLKQLRKKEREKTKGNSWYHLPATEVTEEISNDLKVLQMRSVLDPKHFYKKNDMKVLPKYFQVGKVQDSPLDYYNNRLTKKERKKTLVDELLADHDFCKYNKKKYKEIVQEKQKTHYKAYMQAKRLKRKNKK